MFIRCVHRSSDKIDYYMWQSQVEIEQYSGAFSTSLMRLRQGSLTSCGDVTICSVYSLLLPHCAHGSKVELDPDMLLGPEEV